MRSESTDRFSLFSLLVLVGILLLGATGRAQQAAGQTKDPAQVSLAAATCGNKTFVPGNNVPIVSVLPHTTWQPIDGTVKFTVENRAGTAAPLNVVACFGWRKAGTAAPGTAADGWYFAPLRVLQVDPGKVTYGATVPSDLDSDLPTWTFPWSPWPHDGLGFVPLAQFHVVQSDGAVGWTEIGNMQVGITQPWKAALLVFCASLGAWSVLAWWARQLKIAGGFVRSIITNGNGYTSLSQLQITLWTFVIAAGAVYVMALSGSLIDVPGQMLTLLGISGVATLGAMLPNASSDRKPATSGGEDALPAPVVIERLAMVGTRGATSVVLTWKPSADGAAAVDYVVQRSTNDFATQIEPETIRMDPTRELFAQVTGLAADRAYQFRIVGRDKKERNGTPSAVLRVEPMAPQPEGAAPPLPPPPAGLAKTASSAATAIGFSWTVPQPAADGYLVRCRALPGGR